MLVIVEHTLRLFSLLGLQHGAFHFPRSKYTAQRPASEEPHEQRSCKAPVRSRMSRPRGSLRPAEARKAWMHKSDPSGIWSILCGESFSQHELGRRLTQYTRVPCRGVTLLRILCGGVEGWKGEWEASPQTTATNLNLTLSFDFYTPREPPAGGAAVISGRLRHGPDQCQMAPNSAARCLA